MRLGERRLKAHGLLQFSARVRQVIDRFVRDPQIVMRAGIVADDSGSRPKAA